MRPEIRRHTPQADPGARRDELTVSTWVMELRRCEGSPALLEHLRMGISERHGDLDPEPPPPPPDGVWRDMSPLLEVLLENEDLLEENTVSHRCFRLLYLIGYEVAAEHEDAEAAMGAMRYEMLLQLAQLAN